MLQKLLNVSAPTAKNTDNLRNLAMMTWDKMLYVFKLYFLTFFYIWTNWDLAQKRMTFAFFLFFTSLWALWKSGGSVRYYKVISFLYISVRIVEEWGECQIPQVISFLYISVRIMEEWGEYQIPHSYFFSVHVCQIWKHGPAWMRKAYKYFCWLVEPWKH